ncbi:MAG: hypothetical protein AB7O95_12585 [Geminicoccaceae bacterium]
MTRLAAILLGGIKVHPGASPVKPRDQWNALAKGQIDLASFPLDHAAGKHRQFSRHADARACQESRACQAVVRITLHGRAREDHGRGWYHGPLARLARRLLRLEGELHSRAGRHQGPGTATCLPDISMGPSL